MNCKEKWGYTPNEILYKMDFGLRDGKSMQTLEMITDAMKEMKETEQKMMYNSLLSIIDEINIILKENYKINYKDIYKKIKDKYVNLYMKERPEINADNIDFLEMPNKNRFIVKLCDGYINSNYIKQSINQINGGK